MSDLAPCEENEIYAGLPEETVHSLEQRARRIKGIVAQSALEIGQELADARKEIQRYKAGGFQAWVKAEVGITEQYAYQLIAVYEQFGESKIILLSRIGTTALLLLAASSVPQEARDAAIHLAESGQSITVQQARELIEGTRARLQAEEAVKLAQQQLAEEQARSQEESARLTQCIAELQEEIASLSSPRVEIREVEKEVLPPDVATTLEELQETVQGLTRQRDLLSAKAQQLGADLEALREAREAEREREARALRIRQRWQKATEAFHQNVLKLLGQFPTPLETQVFESEEWERLAQVKATAQRFLAECERLAVETRLMVVDADEER
jgi:hypothetical protein